MSWHVQSPAVHSAVDIYGDSERAGAKRYPVNSVHTCNGKIRF